MAINLMVGDAVSGGGYAAPMPQRGIQGDPQQDQLWAQFQQWLQQRQGGTSLPPPMGLPANVGSDPRSFGRPSTQPMPPPMGQTMPQEQMGAHVMPPSYGQQPMGSPVLSDPRQQMNPAVMPPSYQPQMGSPVLSDPRSGWGRRR